MDAMTQFKILFHGNAFRSWNCRHIVAPLSRMHKRSNQALEVVLKVVYSKERELGDHKGQQNDYQLAFCFDGSERDDCGNKNSNKSSTQDGRRML